MPKTRTHCCAATDCKADIPTSRVFCLPHWKQIPKHIQDAIVNQYRYGITYRCHPTSEWIDARDAACAEIRKKQKERLARHVARNPSLQGI